MDCINSVTLMGVLKGNPEMRYTQGGSPVTSFKVVTTRTIPGRDGAPAREMSDTTACVAWGDLAERVAQFGTDGAVVFVQGRLSNRSYDGQDGQKKWVTEVTCNVAAFPALESIGAPA